MPLIKQVRISTRDEKTLISMKVEGVDERVYFTPAQIKANTGLDTAFHVLKGSDIELEWYKKGDTLVNGNEVTDDNKIVKEFSIEPSALLSQMQMMGAFGVAMKL